VLDGTTLEQLTFRPTLVDQTGADEAGSSESATRTRPDGGVYQI